MATDSGNDTGSKELSVRLTLKNKHGIHVRTAALISELAEPLDAEIIITSPTASSEACDMMRLLLLQAGYGTELQITATGPEAEQAIAKMSALIADGFALEDEIVDDSP